MTATRGCLFIRPVDSPRPPTGPVPVGAGLENHTAPPRWNGLRMAEQGTQLDEVKAGRRPSGEAGVHRRPQKLPKKRGNNKLRVSLSATLAQRVRIQPTTEVIRPAFLRRQGRQRPFCSSSSVRTENASQYTTAMPGQANRLGRVNVDKRIEQAAGSEHRARIGAPRRRREMVGYGIVTVVPAETAH